MHRKATCALFSLLDKLGKLGRRHVFGDCETAGMQAAFGLLFHREADGNFVRTRMTDVSRQLDISKPAATQMVNRLVENGMVERVSDESDRRVVYIQATEKGLEIVGARMEKNLSLIDRVVDRMGAEDASALAVLLERFLDAMVAETEEEE